MNPMYLTDFYKQDHINQYPEGTEQVFSNFTPRSNKHALTAGIKSEGVVVFGVKKLLLDLNSLWYNEFFVLNSRSLMRNYKDFMKKTMGIDDVDTTHFEELHRYGRLPINVRCLPEGTFCPIGVPMLTIVNTEPQFFWLTNFLETYISSELWKPVTSATIAREYRTIFKKYSDITGGNKDFIDFQGHDFSFRGMSNHQDAIKSGTAHLTSFRGTDTVPAIQEIYNTYPVLDDYFLGGSVPATEHSVMCMGSQEGELDTFKRLITEVYPSGPVSIVSDTWDFWKVVGEYLPALKDTIMKRDGKVIIRPDSGDPADILCGFVAPQLNTNLVDAEGYMIDYIRDLLSSETDHGECGDRDISIIVEFLDGFFEVKASADWNRYDKQYYYLEDVSINSIEKVERTLEQKGLIECLWEIFGGTINDKGFKSLDPHIGAIYGDSITLDRADDILKRLADKGFASDNIVLGIGSFTYQHVTRDTFGFAIKSTAGIVNGKTVAIFKDPKTDDGTKTSLKGYLDVINDMDGKLSVIDGLEKLPNIDDKNSALVTAFSHRSGVVLNEPFSIIRDRVLQSI